MNIMKLTGTPAVLGWADEDEDKVIIRFRRAPQIEIPESDAIRLARLILNSAQRNEAFRVRHNIKKR